MSLVNLIDDSLLSEEQSLDPRWLDSPFKHLKSLKAKQAGARYEAIAKSILCQLGYSVEPASHTDHDVIINGIKTEIKGSMLNRSKTEVFSFLQIRPAQDYDQVLFITFFFQEVRLFVMSKQQVTERIASGVFKKQHGGNSANSGTFCFNGSLDKLGIDDLLEITTK